ncbi:MAG: group I intron-associated PD-(D/E)XK endonuclease [Patescibacteria group bacterium]|nr:group I intron-associated PD-(D/E)XK endonuclease [Patescibacteria group bacterium]
MPAATKTKGDIGQVKVMGDLLTRGYKVAIPLGEDWRYDLIVDKNDKLLRIQCKYVESINGVIKVRCETHDGRNYYKYKSTDLDYLAVYDKITDKCYYIEHSYLGSKGRGSLSLRVSETRNKQKKNVYFAKDFVDF